MAAICLAEEFGGINKALFLHKKQVAPKATCFVLVEIARKKQFVFVQQLKIGRGTFCYAYIHLLLRAIVLTNPAIMYLNSLTCSKKIKPKKPMKTNDGNAKRRT